MPSSREIERANQAELYEALRAQAQTQTEWAARLAGQLVNNTLEVWSGVFPAEGWITRSYQVAAGSIYVRNLDDTAEVTVSSAGASGGGVPTGTGNWPVPAGKADTVPLASHQFTLYGTPGDRVAFQVFSGAVRPTTGGV